MVLRARSTPILSLTSDPTSPYLLGLVPAEALGRRPAGVCRHGVDGHDGGLLIRVGVGSIAAGTRGVRDRLHLLYVVDVRQWAGGRRITRRYERPFRLGFDPSEAGQPGHRHG